MKLDPHLLILSLSAASILPAQTASGPPPLPLPPTRLLPMLVVTKPDGSSTTFKRLSRPAVTHRTALAPPAAPAKTSPRQKRVFAVISATIRADGATELRWHAGASGELVALSNVDFRLLTGVAALEHQGVLFEYLIFPHGPEPQRPWSAPARPFPAGLLSSETAHFTLESAARTADEGALAAMEALHAYVEANRARLMAEHAAREAARRERVRAAQAAPLAPPRQEVIHFWKVRPEDIPPEAKARMQGAAAAQAVSTQETGVAR